MKNIKRLLILITINLVSPKDNVSVMSSHFSKVVTTFLSILLLCFLSILSLVKLGCVIKVSISPLWDLPLLEKKLYQYQ